MTAARAWGHFETLPSNLFDASAFAMMMASRCTEQAVQEFLMERGGRVQQMELIDHFLSIWKGDDQSKEEMDCEVLKRIVENVGFVKVEDGVKFVCLSSAESVMRTDTDSHDHEECNGNIPAALHDNNYVNGNPDNGGQTGEEQALCVDFMRCNCAVIVN